jgi:hypothetical protein
MKTTKKQQDEARAVVLGMAALARTPIQAIADIILAYDLWGWGSEQDGLTQAAGRRLWDASQIAVMTNLNARLKEVG